MSAVKAKSATWRAKRYGDVLTPAQRRRHDHKMGHKVAAAKRRKRERERANRAQS